MSYDIATEMFLKLSHVIKTF